MTAIDIRNLKKRYKKGVIGSNLAVQDLTLQVREGEVFGFLGPNGAGKSTVIKILMNFIRPSSGQASIYGCSVSDPQSRQIVGYLPENPFFYDHLTGEEILSFGGLAANMSKRDIDGRIDDLLSRLKLIHVKKQRLRTYSKGMVQRVGLALALIHEPRICILDEPMSGLDPLGRRLVADLIEDMRRNGQTVFFSSHILSDIERLCDRVGILNQGRLLFCGDIKELTAKPGDGLEEAFIRLVIKDNEVQDGSNMAVG